MDLLGSIMSNMATPPTSKMDKKRKEQEEEREKKKEEEKQKRDKFRSKVEQQVNDFIKDLKAEYYKYPVMDIIERTIIHEVAEIAGITSYSFGEEEFGRHIVLFKKDSAPSEEDLNALKRSDVKEYDPEIIKKAREEKKLKAAIVPEKSKPNVVQKPKVDYKEKYERIVGKESGKASAKMTKTNDSFGCVPSKNKKDVRSIEETLNDIRAKKRQKTTNDVEEAKPGGGSAE